ncbi:hypothetical protein GmHk_01G000446 [Glycine max]|nr:hypothetical protein GmHk_01G000446 [Glycine max]
MSPNVIREEEVDDVHTHGYTPSSPSPPDSATHSPSKLKQTRKATRLRSLATRPVGAERPLVHVDLAIGKADGPHKKKLKTYSGIVTHNMVDVTYENWKQVPTARKDLIRENIQAEFDIPEASDLRAKKKILQIVDDKEDVDDTVCEKYDISKEKWIQFCQSRRDPSWGGDQNTPGRVRAIGAGVMIKQYFGSAPRTSRTSSSMDHEDLEQLTLKIWDKLKESITEKVTRQLMLSFSQM